MLLLIKLCHSEEADYELYCLIESDRPTKNLSFLKARSVFLLRGAAPSE
jgi:hypothetical protein